MAKKTPKQLDDEIYEWRRSHRAGPVEAFSPPRYSAKKGGWTGGDPHTLYRFSGGGGVGDERAWWRVVPGQGSRGVINHNDRVSVRVATRAEAEEKWQNPLHSGWTVKP